MNSSALTFRTSPMPFPVTTSFLQENETAEISNQNYVNTLTNVTQPNKATRKLINALAITSIAVGGLSTLGTPYSHIETASTANDYSKYNASSIINQHLFNISLQSPLTRSIKGFSMAIHKLIWELTPAIIRYELFNPGFQLTEDNSLIFALGTKTTDSVMLEFFYDTQTSAFENEISFVGRKAGKVTAEILKNSEIQSRLERFFI